MTTPPMTARDSFTIPDDDTLKLWSARLSARHREWLRVEAFRRRITQTDLIRDLIEREMRKQEEAA